MCFLVGWKNDFDKRDNFCIYLNKCLWIYSKILILINFKVEYKNLYCI